MKLLYFVNSLTNSGGIERILVDKVNYLAALPECPYEIHIAYYGKECEIPFYRLNSAIRLHSIDMNGRTASFSRRIMTVPTLYHHMRRIIKEVKPDVIINESMKLVSYILPFTFKHIPRIYVIHFSYEGLIIMDKESFHNSFKQYVMMWLRKSLLKKYDRFVVLTEHDRKKWNAKTVEVIPNFTNFVEQVPSELKHKKAISIGRLTHQKDMPMLIKSWKLVIKEEPEWTLDIWGSGNEYESLKSLIEETGLEKYVFLRGTTQRIETEYNQASLFVLSSRYEGFALVLLEAMNVGLPCVSFDIPGCNNLISDGDNGIIAKERTTECLANSILKYIRLGKEEKLRMQSNALTTVAKYSKERVMQMWIQLFETLHAQYKSVNC